MGLLEDRKHTGNNSSEFNGSSRSRWQNQVRLLWGCNILSSLHIKTFYKEDREPAWKLIPMILALGRRRKVRRPVWDT